MLTKELEETNEQIEEVLKKEKELLNALNIKEFDFIEHGRYSSFWLFLYILYSLALLIYFFIT